ncbi:hypothetical protein A1O7_08666 [Cladophialophora yegresii CBS 114405]|uniref:F-box domain-containing protein n=1 Tax=Cladophialophora yegresii CBS 114405 TaxID=1182544 RepID=W9VU84_9EURO|nr:uncharacterized protein A1O7_08666 [Cladophialophora yegresii CBS 114405]EXJ55736.1 hypothetical protein A1O7_08666 [Cladophialophora yegresii CBS 114405]
MADSQQRLEGEHSIALEQSLSSPKAESESVETAQTATTTLVALSGEHSNEFPDAIPPHLWYQHQPFTAGQVALFHETPLGKLPGEIRTKIWDYLAATEPEIDITVRLRFTGLRSPPRFRSQKIMRLAGVCRQMRAEVFETMQRSVWFVQRSSKFLHETIDHLRGGNMLRHICFLYLDEDWFLSAYHETRFALVLSEICESLPNLVRFRMSTNEAKLNDQVRERTRDLLRFGAFLVARHPNLDLLIWPGDSGQTHEPGQTRVVLYIDVASSKHFRDRWSYREPTPKYLNERDGENDELSMVEDRLLNATILRRLHFDDILHFDVDDFAIDRENNASSEIDEGHGYFAQVDNEGYLPAWQRKELGKHYIPVDSLIDICERRMRRAMNNGTFQTRAAGARPSRGRGRGRGQARGGRGGGRSWGGARGAARGGQLHVPAGGARPVVNHDHAGHAESSARARGRGRGRGRGSSRGRAGRGNRYRASAQRRGNH